MELLYYDMLKHILVKGENIKEIGMRRYVVLLILSMLMGCSKQEVVPVTTKIIIEPTYERPEELLNKQDIKYVKGKMSGEYLVVTVEGIIKNVKLVSLIWDNDLGLYEDAVIQEIGDLKDETLIIETYHAEGIPSERLIWTTESGEKGSYTLVEDGISLYTSIDN